MRRKRSRNVKKAGLHTMPPLTDWSSFDLSEIEFNHLLDDLCLQMGFCISASAARGLWARQPTTVEDFVEGLFAADGLPGGSMGSLNNAVKRHVQEFIAARRAL
jgi:hypothetical protein